MARVQYRFIPNTQYDAQSRDFVMKAELQFFALPEDAEALLAFAEDKVDAIEDRQRFIIGDCEISFTAGIVQDDILLVGAVAIDTGPVDNSCRDQERAKAAYRSIRKWIKKNYSNRLYSYNLEGERKETAARNHWISPAAAAWKKTNSERLLKLYDTSPIAFDIMIVSKQMGEIKPVANNKVRGHG